MEQRGYVAHISYFLPKEVEDNLALQNEFPGKVDENLISKLGVRSRHIFDKNVKGSVLALEAGQLFFEESGIDRKEIDALIYCSGHVDHFTPSTSCILQHELGLTKDVMTFDLTHGCSGYLYGLALAKSIIAGLGVKNVLFLTASALTRYIDPGNLGLRLLFGDAGSATLVSADKRLNSGGMGAFILGTDGAGHKKLIVKDGKEAFPISETSYLPRTDQFGNVYTDAGMYMDGQSVFMFVLKNVPSIIEQTLAKNKLVMDDIDLFILHQANQFSLEALRKKMNISADRFFYSMERTGNTVQATVPIALREAQRQGRIKQGDRVFITGFGTGLSWGATVLTF